MHNPPRQSVNPHYLDHVVATAQALRVEAAEDIVTHNGIKLLAKGARIDGGARERLLMHKLRKPLEDCMHVVGGVTAAALETAGEDLLDKHPLLRALCQPGSARSAPASLAALSLSPPLQSLLTVYTQCRASRLEHVVGVAMLALALARRLLPGQIDRHRQLALAGLCHDIGELYIDPAYLRRGARLDEPRWRHIVTHPLVAHHVLHEMAGAGPEVADAVLLHHERLDGFGYPRGVSGAAFTVDGEIVAAAEWLMAVAERDPAPLVRACMATRLVPGEFRPELLKLVSALADDMPGFSIVHDTVPSLDEASARIVDLARLMQRLNDLRAWIDERIAAAAPPLRAVLEAGLQRALRIQASFDSTGLHEHNAADVLAELAAQRDPAVYVEITSLVGELEWRLRELERSQRLRSSLLPPASRGVVEELIDRMKGLPVGADAATAAPVAA